MTENLVKFPEVSREKNGGNHYKRVDITVIMWYYNVECKNELPVLKIGMIIQRRSSL